jgi:hypothetical protein
MLNYLASLHSSTNCMNTVENLVTAAQLSLARKLQKREQGPLEIILWRLGFITTDQLAALF